MKSQEVPFPIGIFDPDIEVHKIERRLPHWSQPGTISFITWRTCDSMPAKMLNAWHEERVSFLRSHGIDATATNWRESMLRLNQVVARRFLGALWSRWHDALDAGSGECVLRRSEIAMIVANSFHHFDGERYALLDFVVMPNHVHLIASFPDEVSMVQQCESWKHFTAMQINRKLGNKGRFWQQDSFDHLVRSEEQFRYLRQYIADNPLKARLKIGEFVHYSKVN